MIEYFIDVAKECINIGNFNSLMAVIAGMNLSPVQRLKKTWAKVNQDKLKILEHQMDPSNNFGSYRSSLKAAMWRSQGAAEDREKVWRKSEILLDFFFLLNLFFFTFLSFFHFFSFFKTIFLFCFVSFTYTSILHTP